MDSYATILLVYTLNITEVTQQKSFLSAVTGSYGSIWPCEGPGFMRISSKWLHGLIQLAKCFLCGFCCISATKEPVQPYNFVSRLHWMF